MIPAPAGGATAQRLCEQALLTSVGRARSAPYAPTGPCHGALPCAASAACQIRMSGVARHPNVIRAGSDAGLIARRLKPAPMLPAASLGPVHRRLLAVGRVTNPTDGLPAQPRAVASPSGIEPRQFARNSSLTGHTLTTTVRSKGSGTGNGATTSPIGEEMAALTGGRGREEEVVDPGHPGLTP